MNQFFTQDFFRFVIGFMLILLFGLGLIFGARWLKDGEVFGEAPADTQILPATTTTAK